MLTLSNVSAAFLLISAHLIKSTSAAIYTSGDFDDCLSAGIIIQNEKTAGQSLYFYEGTGNFNTPYKYIWIAGGDSAFVSIPVPWQGYIQRGTDELNLNGQVNMPMTMVEFQTGASDGTGAHGDVSLEQGYDGSATICSTTTTACGGFSQDILIGAPEAALETKPDGQKALSTTVGNWASNPNTAAIDWELSLINQTIAYIQGGNGTWDIASSNNRFHVTFY